MTTINCISNSRTWLKYRDEVIFSLAQLYKCLKVILYCVAFSRIIVHQKGVTKEKVTVSGWHFLMMGVLRTHISLHY